MKFYIPETADQMPKPAAHYAKMAAACRAMGLNIADDSYETIDGIIDGNSLGFIGPRRAHYAEIAAVCREMGLDSDIKDHDYDKIDILLEGGSLRTTTVQAPRSAKAADALVRGFLPYQAKLVVN